MLVRRSPEHFIIQILGRDSRLIRFQTMIWRVIFTVLPKGVPECRPGAPGREGGSSAGHEKIYMTPQNFNFFLCNSM